MRVEVDERGVASSMLRSPDPIGAVEAKLVLEVLDRKADRRTVDAAADVQ